MTITYTLLCWRVLSMLLFSTSWCLPSLSSYKYYVNWVCVCKLSYPACNAHAPYYLSALQYLYTLYHKRYDIRKKNIIENMFLDFSYKFSLKKILVLRRIQRDMIKLCIGLHLNLWRRNYFFLNFSTLCI